MKKLLILSLIMVSAIFLNGAGYKGTLPNLDIIKTDFAAPTEEKDAADLLPLDKLTIPVRQTKNVDKVGVKYISDMQEVVRQLERMKEVLDGDKSYKNFVAAANILNLTTNNILEVYKEERFSKSNQILCDINSDVQKMRDYWIRINRNAPYVSYYTTQGAYSGAVLNEQLNKFSQVLEFAIRDLKTSL